ncbi:hypothetical protein BJY01DRAFT_262417 [Aspergillus pseudoustus]|uniref:Zn(2)-C6 fungal-type domain-containing protein n=1 Tax=Aspergillus pseudoustus TaxID=1810923 RepID=A0ABR4KC77_9EURO
MDSIRAQKIKRARQACANCRRRKTRCSGDQPICIHCRRNGRACVYEPYAVTVGDKNIKPSPPTVPDNIDLLQRLNVIESRLAELSGQSPSHSPLDPPQHVLSSVIDTYFTHVHNQPYSYFHETSFRQKFQARALPRSLLLAVLATAVRFTNNEYYSGRTLEVSELYAREAWLAILADDLVSDDTMNLHLVQALNMLAVVDHTAGRINSGWMKLGLAARISQGMGLSREPDARLPAVEQEERRRVFWSVYLLDKLISCGRSRPIVILDRDCLLCLPCTEELFRNGQPHKTPTLGQILSWDAQLTDPPSPFALVIILASNLGRCTQYAYRNKFEDDIPPWDTRSEYSTITWSLLLFESYVKIGDASPLEVDVDGARPEDMGSPRELERQTYANTLFHVCHCLLNHPFLMNVRCQSSRSKVPRSFAARSLQTAVDHAAQLVQILVDAFEAGTLIESSSYAYCLVVAGTILSIAGHSEDQTMPFDASDMLDHFHRAIEGLERLARFWSHARCMSARLRDFHAQSKKLTSLLNPAGSAVNLDHESEELLWSMLDYGTLATNPRSISQTPDLAVPSSPSPGLWGFDGDFLSEIPAGLSNTAGIFDPPSPAVRLSEIESLLTFNNPTGSYI